ncbi:cytochrome P450 [Amanita rubescens]|nr:cytochrome P450 [Amanita rubescens]
MLQALNAAVFLALLYYGPTIYKKITDNLKLKSIPIVGASSALTSYIGAYRFLKYPKEMMQEGYDKHRGSVFKVPMMAQWMIVVSGPDKIEDIRQASDDVLSLRRALEEVLHTNLTFGPKTLEDTSLADAIRTPLTRSIGTKFPEIYDEITAAFIHHVPASADEWIKIRAYPIMMDIACRASNRMLVGLPLCRNPDYIELNKQFTIDIVKAGNLINTFPSFLKRIVVRFTDVASGIERGMRHLGPLINERLGQEARYGKDWLDKPSDIITWLFEVSKGERPSVRTITTRILFINFAAIHMTSMALTHALFDLATYSDYVEPLRREAEAIIREEGWSKAAISKLSKLDSFVKESLRLAPTGGAFIMFRKVMKDFTFSDGTTIPAGNFMCVPSLCIHTDPDNFDNAEAFDGFRFEKMREQGDDNSKHLLVSLDLDFLLFGHGRHACPGRFLAGSELKTMLAHILLNYDIKLANGNERPKNVWFGRSCSPDPTAEVLFRKRF